MAAEVVHARIDSVTYSGADRPSLSNIDLSVQGGDFLVVTGPPGAGKSTLLMTLNGIIPHYARAKLEGSVSVGGVDTKSSEIYELAKTVGLVLEDPDQQLLAPTVEEEIAFGPINLGLEKKDIRERVRWALNVCRLEKYAQVDPSELSGGMRQALAVAAILAMEPAIIALDEPTALLDPLGSSQLMSTVSKLNKDLGMTVIMATQNLESVAELANRLAVMDNGIIASIGDFGSTVSNTGLLEGLGINPPQVARLASAIGLQKIPYTLSEAVKSFPRPSHMKELGRGGEVQNPSGEPAVVVKNLHHVYENGIEALKGVDLTVSRGEVHALIGQNGSGKTTLAKHLVGLLKPSNQDAVVNVMGIDVTSTKPVNLIRTVNYSFQNPDHQIFSPTVLDELSFGPRNVGFPDPDGTARSLLTRFGMEHLAESNPRSQDRYTKRLIGVLSVLALDPKVLVLDEPTNGLDAKSAASLMKLILEAGVTALLITHDMELVARYSQAVTVLRDGHVIRSGTSREVLADVEMLKSTWLEPPQVFRLMKSLGADAPVFTVEEARSMFQGGSA